MSEVVTCPECEVAEGEIHKHGCEFEMCPFCGLGLGKTYARACECGVTSKELEKIGRRVPFIEYPFFCARCGEPYPEFFLVSDEEWEYYIKRDKRDSVICAECYATIKALIDSNGEK